MEFASADPSVIKSITQRVLLNAWLRALRPPNVLPPLSDFHADGTREERADMMGFDVVGSGDTARYAGVIMSYRACLAQKRPTYTVATVQDADGKDVSYERLLLPFGRGKTVEQLIGSYKAISIEGGFRLNNLMGVTPKTVPTVVIRAVIDRAFVPTRSAAHDSVELI